MAKQRFTLADIRSIYVGEKKSGDRYNLWVYFVTRPLSHYATWLCLTLGISANMVTVAGIIIGIVGCGLIAFGSYLYMISGAVIANVWVMFECMDGDIARCTRSASKYGAFIDDLNSSLISILLFISVGIGVFNHPDPYLNLFLNLIFKIDIDRGIFLFLGGWASLFYIFPRYIGDGFVKIFSQGSGSDKIISRSALLGGLPDKIAFNIDNICGLVMPALLVATIFKFLTIFLLLWALIHTAAFVIPMPKLLKEAKSNNG